MPIRDNDDLKEGTLTHEITSAIISGEFEPGQKLVEEELAARFKLSRTPIREALLELTSNGLVQRIVKKGFFVTSLTKEEIINSYIVAGVLEGFAIAESSHLFFDTDIAFLEQLLEEMKELVEKTSSFKALSLLDTRFHNYLLSKTSNNLLVSMANKAARYMAQYIYFKQWSDLQNLDVFYLRHKKIIDVLKAKDKKTIEQVVRDHYTEVGYMLSNYIYGNESRHF